MSDDWGPPRCSHGHILLGCPDDDCPEQNAYLARQRAAAAVWDQHMADAARSLVSQAISHQASPTTAAPRRWFG